MDVTDRTSGGKNGGGVLLFLLLLFLLLLPRLFRLVRDFLDAFLPLIVEPEPCCPCLQTPGDTVALWAKSTIAELRMSAAARKRRARGVKTVSRLEQHRHRPSKHRHGFSTPPVWGCRKQPEEMLLPLLSTSSPGRLIYTQLPAQSFKVTHRKKLQTSLYNKVFSK